MDCKRSDQKTLKFESSLQLGTKTATGWNTVVKSNFREEKGTKIAQKLPR